MDTKLVQRRENKTRIRAVPQPGTSVRIRLQLRALSGQRISFRGDLVKTSLYNSKVATLTIIDDAVYRTSSREEPPHVMSHGRQ